jgi:hypothetical protein
MQTFVIFDDQGQPVYSGWVISSNVKRNGPTQADEIKIDGDLSPTPTSTPYLFQSSTTSAPTLGSYSAPTPPMGYPNFAIPDPLDLPVTRPEENLAGTCTCGSAVLGSPGHSNWCDILK